MIYPHNYFDFWWKQEIRLQEAVILANGLQIHLSSLFLMTLLHMEEYEDAQFLSLLNKMLAMPDSKVSTTQRVNRKKKRLVWGWTATGSYWLAIL